MQTQLKNNKNLIYDVGMCQGEDTAFYLKKGFTVIAFEANPELITQAKIKFANAITSKQLTIVEGAIIDFSLPGIEKGNSYNVRFFKNQKNDHWGTIVNDWAVRNEQCFVAKSDIIEVPAVDFVMCLEKYGMPYYLKIDIEGMDYVCLESLLEFEQRPDYVSIESDKVSFERLLKEFDLLKQLGYTDFQAINQETVPKQQEPKDTDEGHYSGYRLPYGATGLFGRDLPDNWKNEAQILKQYEKIFKGYRLFGNYGELKSHPDFVAILSLVNLFAASPIPGWYDTHARHHLANLS